MLAALRVLGQPVFIGADDRLDSPSHLSATRRGMCCAAASGNSRQGARLAQPTAQRAEVGARSCGDLEKARSNRRHQSCQTLVGSRCDSGRSLACHDSVHDSAMAGIYRAFILGRRLVARTMLRPSLILAHACSCVLSAPTTFNNVPS